jgi:hypothetical protein
MRQDIDASWAIECRDCRYWVPGSWKNGLCRRKAPVPVPLSFFPYYRAPSWPVTKADDFCGEAVRKGSKPGAVNPS